MIDDLDRWTRANTPAIATSDNEVYGSNGLLDANEVAAALNAMPIIIEAARAVIAWAEADAAGRAALAAHGLDLSDALRQSEAAEARLRAVAKALKDVR